VPYAARNDFSDEGLKEILKVFKSLDVLLVDRNKIVEGKDKYAAKNVFLFY
jgi:hypothetical protein